MFNTRSNDYYNTFIEKYVYKCGGHNAFLRYELGALSEFAYGLWQLNLLDKFVALYPFLGRTPYAHSINLIDPNKYTIIWNGAVSHNQNGINGNGGYGFTNIPLNIFANFRNVHISAYNRTSFSSIAGEGRFIGVNTFDILKDLKQKGAFELNFSRNGGIVGYVYNCINELGGFGYSANQMDSLNITGKGFMIGVNDNKCYLNGTVFGNWFPLLPTDIHEDNPRKLLIFGNRYESSVTSSLRANISFISVGHGLSENDVYNYSKLVEDFQKALFRSSL